MNNTTLIRDHLNGNPWQFRIKLIDTNALSMWSNWIINPSGQYIETENNGPVLISEIEWIEINPIEQKKTGKLIPTQIINHSSEICNLLDDLLVDYWIDDEIIKIRNIL